MRLFLPVLGCLMVLSGLLSGDLAAKPPKEKKDATPNAAQDSVPAKAKADSTKATADKGDESKDDKPASTKTALPAEKGKFGGDAPAVHTVAEGVMKIEVSLSGTLEADSATDVVLRPETWRTFEVVKAVEPGTAVKKGDVLVEFDPETIDEAIKDLTLAQRLSESALKLAEENLRATEASTPLDQEAAQRAKRIANEDLERFTKTLRPQSEKSAKFMLRMAEDSLRYEKEELAQLEKMYKADDLTEETEEIVLKRQRDSVRRAEFQYEMAKTLSEQVLRVTIPREAETVKQAAVRQDLAADKAKVVLPLTLAQQRLEVERLKQERAKSQEKLKKLTADRALMTLRAPTDGVVYFGQCVLGKWSGAESAAKSLRKGGMVQSNDVFMTIVKPRPLFARVSVPEKHIAVVRPESEAKIETAAYPNVKLAASVVQVDNIPSSGDFNARLSIALKKNAPLLMPGMSCTAKIFPYVKKNALTVPASAVFTDELDDEKRYVYLAGDKGKARKRRVTVGQKSENRVEILKGLVAGDRILLERPKSEKKEEGGRGTREGNR